MNSIAMKGGLGPIQFDGEIEKSWPRIRYASLVHRFHSLDLMNQRLGQPEHAPAIQLAPDYPRNS
jgi:hypothetical protein